MNTPTDPLTPSFLGVDRSLGHWDNPSGAPVFIYLPDPVADSAPLEMAATAVAAMAAAVMAVVAKEGATAAEKAGGERVVEERVAEATEAVANVVAGTVVDGAPLRGGEIARSWRGLWRRVGLLW